MKAYELLSKPGAWIQGAYAIDRKANSVNVSSPTAVCWCVSGAIVRCYLHSADQDAAFRKIRFLSKDYIGGIAAWNDERGRTQEQVVALLKDLDI